MTTNLIDLLDLKIKPNTKYTCKPKSNRLFGLKDAPTFYPTKEEFKDSYKYIEKIAQEGSKYGIIKIVPPPDWNPKFAVNLSVSIVK